MKITLSAQVALSLERRLIYGTSFLLLLISGVVFDPTVKLGSQFSYGPQTKPITKGASPDAIDLLTCTFMCDVTELSTAFVEPRCFLVQGKWCYELLPNSSPDHSFRLEFLQTSFGR